ncbi:unnamed protein product, partial [Laminaria digitata]
QENPDCFSPWSTRSFGATTGGISGGGAGGGGGRGIGKGSSLSAAQGLFGPSAGTRVFSLPPWRRGESGTDLSKTAKDHQGGGDKRNADDLEAVHGNDDDDDDGDDGDDDDGGQRRTPEGDRSQRGGRNRSISGSHNKRGNDESGRGGREGAGNVASTMTNMNAETLDRSNSSRPPATAEAVPTSRSPFAEKVKRPPSSGTSSPWPGAEHRTVGDGGGGGGARDDACLTDGSSDDDGGGSTYSRRTQNGDGLLSLNSSSRPQHENRNPVDEEINSNSATCTDAAAAAAAAAAVSAAAGPRRHSSWSAGARDAWIKGGGGGGDGGCGLSEHGRTSRSRVAESQRGDGRLPPVDPETEVAGVHDLERSKRGVSRRSKEAVEFQRISDGQRVVSPTASAQRVSGGVCTVKSPPVSPRVQQRMEARTGRPHVDSQQGDSHGAAASAETRIGAAAAVANTRSPLSRVGGVCVGGKRPSRTGSSLSEESVYPSPELFLQNESRRGTPTAAASRTRLGSDLEGSMTAGTAAGGDREVKQGGVVARASKEREERTEAVAQQIAAVAGGATFAAVVPTGSERTVASMVTAGAAAETVAMGATAALTKKNQESETTPVGEYQLADTIPPSARHRPHPLAAEIIADKAAHPSRAMYGGASSTSRTPDVMSPAGSQGRSRVKAGIMPSDISESQPGTAAAAQVATGVHDNSNTQRNNSVTGDRNVAKNSSVSAETIAPNPSAEAITELSGGGSSDITITAGAQQCDGVNVAATAAASTSPVERGRVRIRKPFCLSPASVAAQAASGSHGRAAASSCEERERLAARIQLSAAGNSTTIDAETRVAFSAQQGDARLSLTLASPVNGSRFGGANPNPRGDNSGSFVSGRGTHSGGGGGEGGGGRGGGGGNGEGCMTQGSSSPVRFHLPSSVTKTAPLCSAGGSTLLHEGALLNSSGGGAIASARALGDGTKAVQGECRRPPPVGLLQPDEEQLMTVRLNEGALIMSRNGLAKMGTVLELEAMYGCGRDALIGLHTLVLSCNQLKVLDTSVLTTMPALRHLDVSHNVLCRMEPMDGRDLPPRLETLNMSNNRISRIGGIGHCFALRVVDLSHNRIKRVQGLEHLSLLEQLDLSHNAITKAASARCLSFNRSLKLLWLEGNPLARHPRYRPTLTCLLPHVRAIDRRGMPPSSDSERRCVGGLSEEGGGGFGLDGVGVEGGVGGGMGGMGGGGRKMGVGVSRECQAEQDERRSKEWRQVMEWREEQARREEETKEKMSQEKQDARHAVNATQQRRQAEELARPRPRTRAREKMINRAKEVACHRPTVVFGSSYRRGGGGGDRLNAPSGGPTRTVTATEPASAAAGKRPLQHGFVAEEGRRMFGVNDEGTRDGYDNTTQFSPPTGGFQSGHATGGREKTVGSHGRGPLQSGATELLLLQQTEGGSPPPPPAPPLAATAFSGRSPQQWTAVNVAENQAPTSPIIAGDHRKICGPHSGLVAGSGGGRAGAETGTGLTVTRKEGGGGGENKVEAEGAAGEEVERWLRDVRLETDTAGTALKVLLKLCQERGRRSEAEELRRLTNFRAALEDMGLFSRQYGPTPTVAGDDESGELTRKVMVAARGVAMTKAAVKNMLRLMEDADPGGDGAAELDQYAHFILQQSEITVAATGITTTAATRNDDTNRFNTTSALDVATTTSEAGPSNTPSAAGASSASVDGVGVSLRSTAIATTTCGPNATPVNLATVPGTDNPEKLPPSSTLRQPAGGDGTAGGACANDSAGRIQLPHDYAAGLSFDTEVSRSIVSNVVLSLSSVTTDPVLAPASIAREAVATTVVVGSANIVTLAPSVEQNGKAMEATVEKSPSSEKGSIDDVKVAPARVSVEVDPTEVEDGRRHHHDDQGARDGANRGESTAAPPSASPLPPPIATSAGGALSPTPTEDDRHGCLADNASVPPSGYRIGTAASTDAVAVPVASVSISSPSVVAATHLSARERLLRHVQTVTSPVSGSDSSSSCSSSDTENDDERATALKGLQGLQGLKGERTGTAQNDNDGLCKGHHPTSGVVKDNGVKSEGHHPNGRDDVDAVIEQEGDKSKAGADSVVDSTTCRPQTTRLQRRRREGGHDDDEDDEHDDEQGCSSKNDERERVAASFETSVSPTNPVVVEGGASVGATGGGDPILASGDAITTEFPVTSLVVAAKASSADISPDREGDRNLAQEAAGTYGVTRDGGNASVGNVHESSATEEPVRSNIDDSPEKTQEFSQSSESSLPVATRQAQSEPDAKNSRGSDAPSAAAEKPLAVEPTSASGSNRGQQHVGVDGDSTVLRKLKEEPREVDDGGSTALEELKEEPGTIGEAWGGITQGGGCGGGGAQTRTETAPDDTAELAWIEGYDPSHDCYYYHHVPTGESRWYKPDEPYEPYVHSDEEEEDGARSTLNEGGGQSKDAQTTGHEDRRDEGKYQKEDENKSLSSRRSEREGGSGVRRLAKREKKETTVESGATKKTGSSSSRKDKASTKLRGSPKSTGRSRRGSEGKKRSSVSSRGGSAAVAEDGASGRSRQRTKTALERLNDLTDEDGGFSENVLSGGSGDGGGGWNEGSVRKGNVRRHRGHSGGYDDEEKHRGSSNKDRHSGGGDSSRRRSSRNSRGGDPSPSRKGYQDRSELDRKNEHNDDDKRYARRHSSSHTQRRKDSSLLSREDVSPSGDDYVKQGRDSSDRRQSSGGGRQSS